jgi:hypothetical protein
VTPAACQGRACLTCTAQQCRHAPAWVVVEVQSQMCTCDSSTICPINLAFVDSFQASCLTITCACPASLCLCSAGVYESSSPDAGDFPGSILGASVAGQGATPGQRWLDVRSSIVRTNMIQVCMS